MTSAYIVGVVLFQNPAPALIDILMALPAAAHTQRRIHMHVVTGQVQADQALENDAEAREGLRQEDEQARGRAPVRHHIEHGAELGGLAEAAGGVAIQGVEQAGDAVEERAGAGVQRHVVEGCEREDDARVAWRIMLGEVRVVG